jgi:hypothetical protein
MTSEKTSENAPVHAAISMPDSVKTVADIVHEGNTLARLFYGSMGYVVPDDYKFYEATHPQEVGCWNQAVIAYDHIEGTDLDDCLAEWLDDQER